MLTQWGAALDKNSVLSEYPRPQLQRDSYLNLNGEWDYNVSDDPELPQEWEAKILVPFSPETVLSGVERTVSPNEFIWYKKEVTLPEGFSRGKLLLHFGAVDQAAKVFINGQQVATHIGGYTPFSADITKAVGEDESFTLTVLVRDSLDESFHTRGKQKSVPGGIWHTAQSGIWQTVWMESVPEDYIRGIRIIPHFDTSKLELWVAGKGECCATIDDVEYNFTAGKPALLTIDDMHPWSPEDPYLYDLELRLGEDTVKSYFAMRKFSVETDEKGVKRLFLNGKPYFFNGVLDQGYWPESLMTPPSDEALAYDIQVAKKMGFNTIRKHMKIESLRYYYHCDRLGMLVWQDMPCGGGKFGSLATKVSKNLKDDRYASFGREDRHGRDQFIYEVRELVNLLYNCPCVAMWIVFNEGWGQFDSKSICDVIYKTDQSRFVDPFSGGIDQLFGEISSKHHYKKKFTFSPDPYDRVSILSEYGGYIHRVDDHAFNDKDYGYQKFDSVNSLKYAIWDLFRGQIKPARDEGLSGAIFTQLYDVEEELDGLMTYDRCMTKIAPSVLENIVVI